jgi:excisionase family DNA binding protein
METLTVLDVARRLNVKKNRVYELIKRKKLVAFRVERQIRILESDLNQFIRDQREKEVHHG